MFEPMNKYSPEQENLHPMEGFASHHPKEVPDPGKLLKDTLFDAEIYNYEARQCQQSYGK
jgi:hypothetical protein